MEINLHAEVPAFVMEPTMLFSYPTCTADVYTPKIERVYLPEERSPAIPVELKVASGHLGTRQTGSLKWKVYKTLTKWNQSAPTLDFSGRFLFEARFDADNNIAHILENICTPVLYAKQLLSEHLNQEIKIYVVLRGRASTLSQQVYETLGIPVICTDGDIFGEIVQMTPFRMLYGIQPQVFNIEIQNYNSQTPDRVFISRRGNRKLSNNDEVCQFLEARGFTTYYFEDLTPSEEWSIARNAKAVVAVHGAGSGNLIFNRLGLDSPDATGLRIVELLSPSFALMTYRHFGTLLNGKWCAVRGQITPETLRYLDFTHKPRSPHLSPMKNPYKVDLQTIELALNYVGVEV
ncbi:MAG: glycosyltransferase family 61 protein [Microcoleus sp. SIO2G3]|nr:glycosyltransferase family 61 protein [Microcoleus sp. SIO2G3]